jgi:hypothetical protein
MSLPRVLTAAALGLFFIGNLSVMREHAATVATDDAAAPSAAAAAAAAAATAAAAAATTAAAATAAVAAAHPQVLLAAATVRQLRSEVATTNALLGRAAKAWHADAAVAPSGPSGSTQLRGATAAVAKQAAELAVR